MWLIFLNTGMFNRGAGASLVARWCLAGTRFRRVFSFVFRPPPFFTVFLPLLEFGEFFGDALVGDVPASDFDLVLFYEFLKQRSKLSGVPKSKKSAQPLFIMFDGSAVIVHAIDQVGVEAPLRE